MTQELNQGTIVKLIDTYATGDYKGYYKITSIRGQYANLGSIFGRCIYHKRVPLAWLVECNDEWYAKWSQSETYQSM